MSIGLRGSGRSGSRQGYGGSRGATGVRGVGAAAGSLLDRPLPVGNGSGGRMGENGHFRRERAQQFRGSGGVQVPLLAFRARLAGRGNRSRFCGSSRVLSGRFGIASRLRLRLVPFRSPRSCAVFWFRALFVLAKGESPPLRLPGRVLTAPRRKVPERFRSADLPCGVTGHREEVADRPRAARVAPRRRPSSGHSAGRASPSWYRSTSPPTSPCSRGLARSR
jgi:hypothetical protein